MKGMLLCCSEESIEEETAIFSSHTEAFFAWGVSSESKTSLRKSSAKPNRGWYALKMTEMGENFKEYFETLLCEQSI